MLANTGIYTIGENNELIYYSNKFKLPEKIYGNTVKLSNRVWNTYALHNESTGIILTGAKGSGKTMFANLLCNIAVEKGINVIFISGSNIAKSKNNTLFEFIDNLRNVVVYMDEFGKMLTNAEQDALLTMFSDPRKTRKLFIVTENKVEQINEYIKDRTERFRYHLDYTKLPKDIYIDYLKHSVVSESFRIDLDNLYNKSVVFSFDNLQGLISEHLRYPDDTLEELIEIMNLKCFKKTQALNIIEVKDNEGNTDYETKIDYGELTLKYILNNKYGLDIIISNRERSVRNYVTINKDNLTQDNNCYIANVKGYTIKLQ